MAAPLKLPPIPDPGPDSNSQFQTLLALKHTVDRIVLELTGASTAGVIDKAVNPTDITNSTIVGRSVITALDAPAARDALGLGAAATQPLGSFLQPTNNLSDVSSVATSRGNLSIAPGLMVRQTVLSGPADSSFLPSLFPATNSALSLTSQNVSSTAPLIVSAAQGFNAYGRKDVIWMETANVSWTGLSANSTNYLYVNASTGARGSTTLAPVYQRGGTPSTTNNQFTFNTDEMKGYLGNGTAAVETPLVFVGEAVTNASTVTSTVAYAYNGYYDTGWIATLAASNTAVSKNANIGTDQTDIGILIKCTTADAQYAVDDIVTPFPGYYARQVFWREGRNKIGYMNVAGVVIPYKSSGGDVTLTAASWSYKLTARRIW